MDKRDYTKYNEELLTEAFALIGSIIAAAILVGGLLLIKGAS